VLESLRRARERSRETLLDAMTELEGRDRIFRSGSGVRRLDDAERAGVIAAYERYLTTIPAAKRLPPAAYTVVDVVGRPVGCGDVGLTAPACPPGPGHQADQQPDADEDQGSDDPLAHRAGVPSVAARAAALSTSRAERATTSLSTTWP
jgi:uncharacterized protein (DUF2252 family)